MIQRLRTVCQQDDRLLAAMLYGSFARGEADKYSDIDVILYFADDKLPGIDQLAWVSQISTVELYYRNEFGNGVAIFPNLVRAEFHFDPASKILELAHHQGTLWFPSLETALLVDKRALLSPILETLIGAPASRDTRQDAEYLFRSFLNWFLFGSHVSKRGEAARALEILHLVQDYLLRMVRVLEGADTQWITPTKNLKNDISPAAYERFRGCTARLDEQDIHRAYQAAWVWGLEMAVLFAQRWSIHLPERLIEEISQYIHEGD